MRKKLVIYGPTATGKTDLALQLARKFQGELISADSRQVYRGLDIGTGKVSFDSKIEKHEGYWLVNGIKINGFDLVNPGEQFTVADFVKFASTTLFRIDEAGKLPIIVGGTGFYIKALTSGIDSIGIGANYKLRNQLEKLTVPELYQKLLELDFSRAKSMNQSDRANPRRLVRAIEIAQTYLTPGVSQVASKHTPGMSMQNVLVIGLTAPNEFLYNRADKWLEARLEKGLIEEVEALITKGVNQKWLDNLGLEYRWLTRYLKGSMILSQTTERLKGDIHNFIRRQKTWFLKFANIKLLDISDKNWQSQLGKTLKDWYNQKNGPGKSTN